MQTKEVAVIAAMANAGDVGQPPEMERTGAVSTGTGTASITSYSSALINSRATACCSKMKPPHSRRKRRLKALWLVSLGNMGCKCLRTSRRKPRSVFQGTPERHWAARPQAQPLAVAQGGRWPTTDGHWRRNLLLVPIVDSHVQCRQEGFQIHGHFSAWQKDLTIDYDRNLPFLSFDRQMPYASSV